MWTLYFGMRFFLSLYLNLQVFIIQEIIREGLERFQQRKSQKIGTSRREKSLLEEDINRFIF